jgi:hypothetical protein
LAIERAVAYPIPEFAPVSEKEQEYEKKKEGRLGKVKKMLI